MSIIYCLWVGAAFAYLVLRFTVGVRRVPADLSVRPLAKRLAPLRAAHFQTEERRLYVGVVVVVARILRETILCTRGDNLFISPKAFDHGCSQNKKEGLVQSLVAKCERAILAWYATGHPLPRARASRPPAPAFPLPQIPAAASSTGAARR